MSSNEIINIQVGSCGNNIGTAFWTEIIKEHALEKDGAFNGNRLERDNEIRLERINSYFHEKGRIHKGLERILTTGYIRENIESKHESLSHIPSDVKFLCKHYIGSFNGGYYIPRSILIDLDPNLFDIIKTSSIGDLFNKNNFIVGTNGCGNNWAKGYCTEGAMLIDEIMFDIVRLEAEKCEYLQGFELCHSIGGGTGSGFGTLILERLKDNYRGKINETFTVYPSPKVSDVVVEPYNAILSLDKMMENADQTFVIDNEALFSISHNVLKQKEPKYSDLNWITSVTMSSATSSYRFEIGLNQTLKRMRLNMVLFPRLHYLLTSYAPLFTSCSGSSCNRIRINVQEITDQMWSSRNFLANIKSEDGRYCAASMIYKGTEWPTPEIDDETNKIQQKMADYFVTWIPNNVKIGICMVPCNYTSKSGLLIANTTAIKGVFQRLSRQFSKMYYKRNKAFLHWYEGEGMNEMEFQEAHQNINDLITEYQDKQDVVVDIENYYDDEDTDEVEVDEDYDDDEDF